MTFLEKEQESARTWLLDNWKDDEPITQNDMRNIDDFTKQTITNTLNHILESGLLEEEKDCGNCNDCEAMMSCPRKETHNDLASDIKEFMSKLIKK